MEKCEVFSILLRSVCYSAYPENLDNLFKSSDQFKKPGMNRTIIWGQVSKFALLIKNFLPGLAVSPLGIGETSLRLTKRENHPQGWFSFRFVPRRGLETYSFGTPFGYFISLRS